MEVTFEQRRIPYKRFIIKLALIWRASGRESGPIVVCPYTMLNLLREREVSQNFTHCRRLPVINSGPNQLHVGGVYRVLLTVSSQTFKTAMFSNAEPYCRSTKM